MLTRSLSCAFNAVNRPMTGGGTLNPNGLGTLGLTDATSKASAATDCAARWDAPSSTASAATTTALFIFVPQRDRTPTACRKFHAPQPPSFAGSACRKCLPTAHRLARLERGTA